MGGEVQQSPATILVVRGGTFVDVGFRAAMQNAGRVHAAYGSYGVCVAWGPNMTLRDAVLSRPLRNPKLSVTDVARLRDGGFTVSAEPGTTKHLAGILWLPDRDPETFNRLAGLFDVVDSPFTRDERRLL